MSCPYSEGSGRAKCHRRPRGALGPRGTLGAPPPEALHSGDVATERLLGRVVDRHRGAGQPRPVLPDDLRHGLGQPLGDGLVVLQRLLGPPAVQL